VGSDRTVFREDGSTADAVATRFASNQSRQGRSTSVSTPTLGTAASAPWLRILLAGLFFQHMSLALAVSAGWNSQFTGEDPGQLLRTLEAAGSSD
jgi:hypothetical protein